MSGSREQQPNRPTQVHGQRLGLIETAPEFTPRVKRHRNHAVRIGEHRRAGVTHQRAEPRRNRMPAIVFERMDDVLRAAVVGSHRRAPGDRMRRAETLVQCTRAADGGPAQIADGAVKRATKRTAARRALRLE